MYLRFVPLVCFVLSACAPAPLESPPADPKVSACLEFYNALDAAVARAGTTPAAFARIPGFPFLRVDRFLSDYRDRLANPEQQAAWLARLADLDRQARIVELGALPPDAEPLPSAAKLQQCPAILPAQLLTDPERFARLRRQTVVADDYRTVNQILGLYPLLAFPIRRGIDDWHQAARAMFAQPLAALPVQGRLQRFQPPEPAGSLPVVQLRRDALGIPDPGPEQLTALFAAYAPVWEIDTAGDFDRPGAPRWRADGVPTVDPVDPVIYRYPSWTLWRGQAVLQLNYVIWFSERPRTGSLDILGGALDGLVWRVTLDGAGRPLVYDSIHNCGCYQQFFPTAALRPRPELELWSEPPLIPQTAPDSWPGTRLVIRLESGSHFIQRVYRDVAGGAIYRWQDYAALYAVPVDQGQRSLFDPDGLVPGTERPERFLLWPMGVPSPGAMRERGRQATAFLGRRHFDDPDLLERVFEPAE